MTRKASRQVLRMRKLRRDREWSLKYAAQRVGVTAGFLCNVEARRRTPSLSMASDIARLYGVSIEELFDEVEMPA